MVHTSDWRVLSVTRPTFRPEHTPGHPGPRRSGKWARTACAAFGCLVFLGFYLPEAGYAQFSRPPRAFGYGSLEELLYTPDEELLVAVGSAGVHVFDAHTLTDVALLQRYSAPYTPTRSNNLNFSPDSRWLAVSYLDTTVVVWDLKTFSQAAVLTGHGERVSAVAFCAEGQYLATGDRSGNMKVWDTATWERVAQHGQEWVRAMAFPSTDRLITSNGYRAIRVWQLPSFVEEQLFVHEDNVEHLIVAPDQRRLVSGANDGTVRLWDLESGAALAVLPAPGVYTSDLALSPDGRTVAFTSDASTYSGTHVWSLDPVEEISAFAYPNAGVIGFSGDGTHLFLWGIREDDSTALARTWDIGTRQFVDSLDVGAPGRPAWAPQSRRLTMYHRDAGMMETYDLAAHTMHRRRVVFPDVIRTVAFSPGGEWIAAGFSHSVHLWDVGSRQPLAALDAEISVRDIAFSADCRDLLVVTIYGLFRWPLMDVDTFQPLHEESQAVAAFAPGAGLVALGERHGEVTLYDLEGGAELTRFAGHPDDLRTLALAPDGSLLAVGGLWFEAPAAWLWRVADHQLLGKLGGHRAGVSALAFSPDSRLLASAGLYEGLQIWTTEPIAQVDSIATGGGVEDALGFSPDGRWLAWGEPGDHPLQLWEVETGTRLPMPGAGRPFGAQSLAFSPGGDRIALGTGGQVLIWEADPGVGQPLSSPCETLDFPWNTAVEETAQPTPRQVALSANYPNPFNGRTLIPFSLPHADWVQLEVYDLLGQRLRVLARGSFPAGEHALSWNGRDGNGQSLASGVYLLRLQAGSAVRYGKTVLVR